MKPDGLDRCRAGPEYGAPENLERLRSRGLAGKRSLALREFALGIERLQRIVRREPLRRIHETRYASYMRSTLGFAVSGLACIAAACHPSPGAGADGGLDAGDGPTVEEAGVVCSGGGSVTGVFPLPAAMVPAALASDALGNVYVAGLFTGTVTVGATTLTASGANDMFLVVFDPSGKVVRAARYGSDFYDDPSPGLAVDAAGNAYLSGFFSSTLDFGNGVAPLVAIAVDAFVVRFDPTGNAVWARRFGYSAGPYDAASVALAPNGDPVIAGTAAGTIVLGPTTWPSGDAANEQPYVARLSAADGSVIWSAASGGTLHADKMHVAVDAAGTTFIAGGCLSGESAWGPPPPRPGQFCTFRLGFDSGGNPLWSRFDDGGQATSLDIDHAGHVVVGESFFDHVSTDEGRVFTGNGWVLSLLTDPLDGSVISGAVGDNFFWSAASDPAHPVGYVAGDWSYAGHLGAFSFPNVPAGQGSELFVGAIDESSTFVWAREIGAGTTSGRVVHVLPSGAIAIAGITDTAFATEGGNVPVGSFVLVVSAPACNEAEVSLPNVDAGIGKLRDAEPTPDVTLAPCPNDSDAAVNGAACPGAMGCSYGTVCCFCAPEACGNEPTLWTCNDLAGQDPSCPASPPAPGGTCPANVHCDYCLTSGRFFADCTAGGWSTGYAQIVCN